jgi:uncharacterized membrane protein YphA (DoxX/SURF4 family)
LAIFAAAFFSFFNFASAHEAYVVPYGTFWSDMHARSSTNFLEVLHNKADLKVAVYVILAVLAGLTINFFFRRSAWGRKSSDFIERFSHLGPQFVRYTVATAFFLSAYFGTFLGPELHGSLFAHPELLRVALFLISILIALGFLTELAALAGIIIFLISFGVFKSYMFTYTNYLGELIVLLLFGMRVFSLDKYIFGPLRRFRSFEKYETVIVRVMYGLALAYTAINVKIFHPDLTVLVVNAYHLNSFHWLFPSDPVLITLGAGIVETVIGLFIIFGFEMRLTVLVSLFYLTLSIIFFKESVWPHLLLYGISLDLLVQPEVFTLDHLFLKHHRAEKKWWKRPFSPHNVLGKSSRGALDIR